MKSTLDAGNLFVIILTVVLFVAALFLKGITKDLLLEAGVLLVSAKLVIFNYRQSLHNEEVLRKLEDIQKKFIQN